MRTNIRPVLGFAGSWRVSGWALGALALISFAMGAVITAGMMRLRTVQADGERVFELNVYHAVPGKVAKLEERFSDASKLLARHNLNVIAYWVPNDDAAFADTFIYVVAAPSREEMEKNWDAFHADPEFQKYRKAENAEKLIEKVDSTYMRPTEYSAIK